jgi:uncharacterized membrane protein YkgB
MGKIIKKIIEYKTTLIRIAITIVVIFLLKYYKIERGYIVAIVAIFITEIFRGIEFDNNKILRLKEEKQNTEKLKKKELEEEGKLVSAILQIIYLEYSYLNDLYVAIVKMKRKSLTGKDYKVVLKNNNLGIFKNNIIEKFKYGIYIKNECFFYIIRYRICKCSDF